MKPRAVADAEGGSAEEEAMAAEGSAGAEWLACGPCGPCGPNMLGAATPGRGASHCGVPCGPKGRRKTFCSPCCSNSCSLEEMP